MRALLYLRLVYLTAGTLLAFFWMVVILGHRRQRNLERVFFFLCLALVSFFGCRLLALNAHLYYGTPPSGLLTFAWVCVCLGLWLVPSLLVHLHVEYAELRGLVQSAKEKWMWLAASYVPAVALSPQLMVALRAGTDRDFDAPSHVLGTGFQVWLVISIAVGAYWQRKFGQLRGEDTGEKSLFRGLRWDFVALAVFLAVFMYMQHQVGSGTVSGFEGLLAILVFAPFVTMIREVQRFNFLDIGRQRNLIYAVFLTFVALLYLSLVRRASLWLDPYLPPEATAALLLFLPVIFLEPLQRMMRKLLRQTAQTELDRAQKLMGPINEVARLGDQDKLATYCEEWIAEQLQLAEVKLELGDYQNNPTMRTATLRQVGGITEIFEVHRGLKHVGHLRVRPHGAMISGETYAGLELVSEQLPAAFDLCRLIEEKLQLERELAERERLALVGQMAASISHNLKNPLGSIKTILQVQMESAELPSAMRQETQMVLGEIARLSAKLNQLLQFSRPGIRSKDGSSVCDVGEVVEQVVSVFRHEAEEKGVALELESACKKCVVAASAEAMSDILSNVVLNAIEAVDRGGHVRMMLQSEDGVCHVDVADDGPGIPEAVRSKIHQPFFTTKPRGTGLGLAIVQRRLEEVGGTLETKSPVSEARGSRFRITIPAKGIPS